MPTSVGLQSAPFPLETTELSSVAEHFGYSEGSKYNTLALVQKVCFQMIFAVLCGIDEKATYYAFSNDM